MMKSDFQASGTKFTLPPISFKFSCNEVELHNMVKQYSDANRETDFSVMKKQYLEVRLPSEKTQYISGSLTSKWKVIL